jgi:hypothetical protein
MVIPPFVLGLATVVAVGLTEVASTAASHAEIESLLALAAIASGSPSTKFLVAFFNLSL